MKKKLRRQNYLPNSQYLLVILELGLFMFYDYLSGYKISNRRLLILLICSFQLSFLESLSHHSPPYPSSGLYVARMCTPSSLACPSTLSSALTYPVFRLYPKQSEESCLHPPPPLLLQALNSWLSAFSQIPPTDLLERPIPDLDSLAKSYWL